MKISAPDSLKFFGSCSRPTSSACSSGIFCSAANLRTSSVILTSFVAPRISPCASSWAQTAPPACVNRNYAPVIELVPTGFDAHNQPIGGLQPEYGHDPTTVGSHDSEFIRAMHQAGEAVTVKHFPGLGRVTG